MSGWQDCLRRQAAAHPAMAPQDAAKLCHQAAFGPAHLLDDPARARQALGEEFSRCTGAPGAPVFEPLSGAYCRCDIAAWKGRGLPADWLWGMFAHTAAEGPPAGGTAVHAACLAAVETLAEAGELPFSAAAWRAFRRETPPAGVPRHSETYRLRERPAYRVVDALYAPLLPVLETLAALPSHSGARVIAIDGRAAAGKSTAAGLLAAALGAGVAHMDDFFLPPALRTPERLAEPGGNVHYERFAAEVLPHLAGGGGFRYRRFDCTAMAFGALRDVPAGAWRIVEGAYSHHPRLGAYADLRAFFDVSPDEQRRRILARDGAAAWESFAARWIPMEERYLAAFAVREHAHVVVAAGG